ncbi:hypothetical protein [Oenococcus oeni]|uniref:hypothetical protein n=1 Tax=Oenococcus oeni TaxID=1247 RepID=UPI00050E65FB|nr:hypothetical protein [Oenococcus oeni]KGI01060.1 hypothetical protein X293_07770 [Oenococcus oeni IOEB_C52]OIM22357.1 hypothetical protein ATX60_09910 [Oenococcus oeni]OLQ40879.1 hypothetical protein ATX28_02550 [Oenococcus oeni]
MTEKPLNRAIDCVCGQYLILACRRLWRFEDTLSPYFAYKKARRSADDDESFARQDELLRTLYHLFQACPVLKAKYSRRTLSIKELCTAFHCSETTISRRLRTERAYFAAHFKLFDLNQLGNEIQDRNYKGIVLHI